MCTGCCSRAPLNRSGPRLQGCRAHLNCCLDHRLRRPPVRSCRLCLWLLAATVCTTLGAEDIGHELDSGGADRGDDTIAAFKGERSSARQELMEGLGIGFGCVAVFLIFGFAIWANFVHELDSEKEKEA
mmetsp:Transcript_143219/g.247877  ORF Transcript_143219/g.247877 Transcript_143219/m.247877 type:complete len:129 (-) Transcript_143219:24-410(-)